MGYESRFYVIEKSSLKQEIKNEEKTYGQTIAIFDMCKLDYTGAVHELIKESKPTNSYVYADDGDTKIVEDSYGEPLKEIDITELIVALKKDDTEYRRMKPFIAFLEAINNEQWGKLVALHFGY